MRFFRTCLAITAILLVLAYACLAQEKPYFITYSHDMEEPGNLEIENQTVAGRPFGSTRFFGSTIEFEYGVKAWWTTELYLEGQSTRQDSTVFTGFRIENRFRVLPREHWINPVLYVEFEDINGANKSLREVVGHDGNNDLIGSNFSSRAERKRELELKLILSSNFKGWNVSENIIFEKNLTNSPWEFGYAWAASRPLKFAASARPCSFCREKFSAGVEMYGGLGDRYHPGLHETSHYFGPALLWNAPHGVTVKFSPQFGLNDHSVPRLYRFGVSYEINQLFSRLGFRGHSGGKN